MFISPDALRRREELLARVCSSWYADVQAKKASIAILGRNAFVRFGMYTIYPSQELTNDEGILHINRLERLTSANDPHTGLTIYDTVCALIPEMSVWSMGSIASENIADSFIAKNYDTLKKRQKEDVALHDVKLPSSFKPRRRQSAAKNNEGLRLWVLEKEGTQFEYTLVVQDYAENM